MLHGGVIEVETAPMAAAPEEWQLLHADLKGIGVKRSVLDWKELSMLLEAEETRLYRRLGFSDAEVVRLTTRRGTVEVPVEVTEMMQPGHISLPNGEGMDYNPRDGGVRRIGVAPNELTGSVERDFLAGTPWHKHVPAQVERIG